MNKIIQTFETYQKARIQFVQTIAELSSRPQNLDALQTAGVMSLLRPLLLDNVPSIQQSAALALGRLASYSDDLAESIVSSQILPQLVYSLAEQNRFYKKAAAFVLRSVAKHSAPLAQAVVDCGALESLVICLEEFDPSLKEAAAWALSCIAKHTPDLAQAVVDAGALPLLILCVQEPEITLKRVSAGALAEICKHSQELAQSVVDHGAAPYLSSLLTHSDSQLKRQVCGCLAQIAKHGNDLASAIVIAQIFPKILNLLKDQDIVVRKNTATCIREIVKHSPELAKLVVNSGGIVALVDYINVSRGNSRLPGIMTLGYIAAYDESLAKGIIAGKGLSPLRDALINEGEDHVKAAAAWTLGQIGGHSPDHARAAAEMDVPSHLLTVYMHSMSSDDLKGKAKKALKNILKMCVYLPALEPLISEAPGEILTVVLEQFAKILPNDGGARKMFVMNDGLAKIQKINRDPGSKLGMYVEEINSLYPAEVVQYYSPEYAETLLRKMDEYVVG